MLRVVAFTVGTCVSVIISASISAARFEDQSTDVGRTSDPLQIFIDAVPALASSAVTEARRDLTADDARELLQGLANYYKGLSDDPNWPSNSIARYLPPSPYAFAERVYSIIETLPIDVEKLVRAESFCGNEGIRDSEIVNATSIEARSALARLNATIFLLDRLEPPALEGIDLAPLAGAARFLEGLRDDLVSTYHGCLGEINYVHFQLIPSRVWRTGSVGIIGFATVGNASSVRVQSDGFGFQRDLPISAARFFSTNFSTSATAPLGVFQFRATAADFHAAANLTITLAPTRLTVQYPTHVYPSSTLPIRVDVHGPAREHFGTGPLQVSGDHISEAPLGNGSASFALTASSTPAILNLRVDYPGSQVHLPSQVDLQIRVVPNPSLEEPRIIRSQPFMDLQLSPNVFNAFLFLGPLVFVLFLVMQGLDQRVLSQRRARLAALQTESDRLLRRDPYEEAPEFSPNIVPGISRFFDWMLRRGRVRPGQTLRESAETFQKYGSDPWPVILAFEKIRYGGYEEPERLRRLFPLWMQRMWKRMRGWRR